MIVAIIICGKNYVVIWNKRSKVFRTRNFPESHPKMLTEITAISFSVLFFIVNFHENCEIVQQDIHMEFVELSEIKGIFIRVTYPMSSNNDSKTERTSKSISKNVFISFEIWKNILSFFDIENYANFRGVCKTLDRMVTYFTNTEIRNLLTKRTEIVRSFDFRELYNFLENYTDPKLLSKNFSKLVQITREISKKLKKDLISVNIIMSEVDNLVKVNLLKKNKKIVCEKNGKFNIIMSSALEIIKKKRVYYVLNQFFDNTRKKSKLYLNLPKIYFFSFLTLFYVGMSFNFRDHMWQVLNHLSHGQLVHRMFSYEFVFGVFGSFSLLAYQNYAFSMKTLYADNLLKWQNTFLCNVVENLMTIALIKEGRPIICNKSVIDRRFWMGKFIYVYDEFLKKSVRFFVSSRFMKMLNLKERVSYNNIKKVGKYKLHVETDDYRFLFDGNEMNIRKTSRNSKLQIRRLNSKRAIETSLLLNVEECSFFIENYDGLFAIVRKDTFNFFEIFCFNNEKFIVFYLNQGKKLFTLCGLNARCVIGRYNKRMRSIIEQYTNEIVQIFMCIEKLRVIFYFPIKQIMLDIHFASNAINDLKSWRSNDSYNGLNTIDYVSIFDFQVIEEKVKELCKCFTYFNILNCDTWLTSTISRNVYVFTEIVLIDFNCVESEKIGNTVECVVLKISDRTNVIVPIHTKFLCIPLDSFKQLEIIIEKEDYSIVVENVRKRFSLQTCLIDSLIEINSPLFNINRIKNFNTGMQIGTAVKQKLNTVLGKIFQKKKIITRLNYDQNICCILYCLRKVRITGCHKKDYDGVFMELNEKMKKTNQIKFEWKKREHYKLCRRCMNELGSKKIVYKYFKK